MCVHFFLPCQSSTKHSDCHYEYNADSFFICGTIVSSSDGSPFQLSYTLDGGDLHVLNIPTTQGSTTCSSQTGAVPGTKSHILSFSVTNVSSHSPFTLDYILVEPALNATPTLQESIAGIPSESMPTPQSSIPFTYPTSLSTGTGPPYTSPKTTATTSPMDARTSSSSPLGPSAVSDVSDVRHLSKNAGVIGGSVAGGVVLLLLVIVALVRYRKAPPVAPSTAYMQSVARRGTVYGLFGDALMRTCPDTHMWQCSLITTDSQVSPSIPFG